MKFEISSQNENGNFDWKIELELFTIHLIQVFRR